MKKPGYAIPWLKTMTQATRYVFRLFLLATLLQLPGIIVFAQYDNNWYFGRKAALNFSTGTPQVITNSSLQTMEACASISDENGQLLFYTNGVEVYYRNNTLMGSTPRTSRRSPPPRAKSYGWSNCLRQMPCTWSRSTRRVGKRSNSSCIRVTIVVRKSVGSTGLI